MIDVLPTLLADASLPLFITMFVAIIGGGICVMFLASATPHKWEEILKQDQPAPDVLGCGPIRRYPVETPGELPPAIAALGEAEYVHRYESFAEQCQLGWLYGKSADKYPSYLSYADALVVVTPEACTVIPWEEITEFLHTVGFKASNGQKFVIGPDFTNYGPLYERLNAIILDVQLPRAVAAVAGGQEWIFEPFTRPAAGSWAANLLGQTILTEPLAVSREGLRYGDQRLVWDEIASIQVTRHLKNGLLCRTTLSIRKKYHLLSALEFDFSSVANSFLLTELLPHVCPPRLLVPAGAN